MLKVEYTGQFKQDRLVLELLRTGTHSDLF